MGRLLEKLLKGSDAYTVRREADGFTFTGDPDRLEEFSDLVRELSEHAGDELVVFPVSDGRCGYRQMYVMPLDDTSSPSSGATP